MSSAEPFLDQAADWLGLRPDSPNASAKARAIAAAMTERRVLLVLDGLEPLQEPPGPQFGRLRDNGLRELLRRVAAQSAGAVPGLIVITSRAPLTELDRFRDAAPGRNLENLSPQAGAALLHDVLMRDAAADARPPPQRDLEKASKAHGGHALSLSLLASYIRKVWKRDFRRWFEVRSLPIAAKKMRQHHTERVLKSYVDEWLAHEPQYLAVMHMIGLFDRPADEGCLRALRDRPAIPGLTDDIVGLLDDDWALLVDDLREAKLLLEDSVDGGLDAHPLVREYFGIRLEQENPEAWRAAHSRIYDRLTQTKEGDNPDLAAMAPLFQAIKHGVFAERTQETLSDTFLGRLCRINTHNEIEYYAARILGARGQILNAASYIFEEPYSRIHRQICQEHQVWLILQVGIMMLCVGRITDSTKSLDLALSSAEQASNTSAR